MEKKTTRRIIGVLVIFALVIIVLPLFVNNSSTQSSFQTAEMAAPPFPDQQNNASDITSKAVTLAQSSQIPPSATGTHIKHALSPTTSLPKGIPTTADAHRIDTHPIDAHSAEIISANTQARLKREVIKTLSEANKTEASANTVQTPAALPAVPEAVPAESTQAKQEPQQPAAQQDQEQDHASNKPVVAPNDNPIVIGENGDASSAQATTTEAKPKWLIQVGTFRSKANAQRLVASLQAKGYNAYTSATSNPELTCVYVAPASTQVASAAMIDELENATQMRGIVVPAKA